MRIAFVCLALAAAPLAGAHAGEIGADHRGTWTENGDCAQPRRIVITDNTVKLVEPGRTRVLTDGDEAVFKGETMINASLPAKKAEDPELAFSAKLVEEDGEMRLVTDGLEDKAFAGAFMKCKAPTHVAAKDKSKPKRAAAARQAPRYAPAYASRFAPYAYPPGSLLGGLY